MTQTPIERLFIVEATNWKEAVISLLEPESSYMPWRCDAGDAEEGDAVAFVLNTDPLSVLTDLGNVGVDGDPARANSTVFDRPSGIGRPRDTGDDDRVQVETAIRVMSGC